MISVTGFLLTRHWCDGPDGFELVLWAHSTAGPLRLVFRGQRAVCFTAADTALDPADLPGLRLERQCLRLRAAFWRFESFELGFVADRLLRRRKLIEARAGKIEEIRRLFREDRPALAAYNLEDCRLVEAIFEKADLIDFALQRAIMTGLSLGRQGGSVAAFDNLYLPRLHRAGAVAPDVGASQATDISIIWTDNWRRSPTASCISSATASRGSRRRNWSCSRPNEPLLHRQLLRSPRLGRGVATHRIRKGLFGGSVPRSQGGTARPRSFGRENRRIRPGSPPTISGNGRRVRNLVTSRKQLGCADMLSPLLAIWTRFYGMEG